MTKKELVWRLKEKPTVREVSELMTQGIITKDEARDILFNERNEKDQADDAEALKKQIKFLEGLVQELSKNQHLTTIPVYIDRYIERWKPFGPIWTYSTGAVTGTTLTGSVSGGAGTSYTALQNYTQTLVNS